MKDTLLTLQRAEVYDVRAERMLEAAHLFYQEVRVGAQIIDVRAAVLSHTSAWNLTGLPAIR